MNRKKAAFFALIILACGGIANAFPIEELTYDEYKEFLEGKPIHKGETEYVYHWKPDNYSMKKGEVLHLYSDKTEPYLEYSKNGRFPALFIIKPREYEF